VSTATSQPGSETGTAAGKTRWPAAVVDALWGAGLVAGMVTIWLARVVWSAKQMSLMGAGDLFGYFLPAYTYEAERFAHGGFPFWNPYQGAGVPFLATLQPAALYPTRLLLLVVSPARAMGWSIFLHVVLGGLATFALCRRLGADRPGAAVGAIVFTGASALPNLTAVTQIEPAAWLPVLAFAVVAVVEGGGWGWTLFLGLAGSMPALAGGYQPVVYGAFGLVLFVVALAADVRWRAALFSRRVLGRLAVAGLLAFATAAPQLVPTFAWSVDAVRRMQPLTVLQMIPLFTEAAYWGRIRMFFFRELPSQFCYLSVPVVALAIAGTIGGRGFGLVVGASAIGIAVLATARPDTMAITIYRALPGFAMFRFPVRMLFLTAFFTAIVAALGATLVRGARPFGTARRRMLVGVGAVAATAGLLLGGYRNDFFLPWAQPYEMTLPESRFFPTLGALAGHDRIFVPADRFDLRLGSFVREGMRQRVRVLQDYDPLSSRRLGAFLAAVSGLPPPGDDAFPAFSGAMMGPDARTIARPDLLDLVAVRAIVTPRSTLPAGGVPGWRLIESHGDLDLYANDSALPRAYVVGRARFVPTETEALATIVGRDFDGHREVVLVGEPEAGEAALATATATPAVSARIAVDDPEHVVIDVDGARSGVVVLADAAAPGWKATVDGVPRRLWRANHLVRGVAVGPGDRRVELRYRAPGFRLGVALAVATWSVVLLALAIARRRHLARPLPPAAA
jgi:hypothetical protein